MDKALALKAVEAFLAESQRRSGIEMVVLSEKTIEFASGWMFFYDSKKHVESGSIRDALAGNAPLIVSLRDGSVHATGTARPTEDYIREFESRHHR